MTFEQHAGSSLRVVQKHTKFTSHKKQSSRRAHQGVTLYLTGSEGDPVVELHAVLLLAVIQPLPADADGHGSQIVVNPEIVLMLWWGQAKKCAN